MKLKLKRTPGIYLVGFMGCGKTTVGRLFAEEIGWRFADLDDDIEAEQKCSISELFDRLGEEEFRRIESEAIWKRIQLIRRGMPTVLALGGGAFTREKNIEMLIENGVTVWLDTAFEVVRSRVASSSHRPLARDPERFAMLYSQRRPFYERAEYRVHVPSDDSKKAAAELIALDLLD
jgi:shikimate kinase